MSGPIISICSVSAFSAQQAAVKRCRKGCNKEQEKRELWDSRSRRWTLSRVAASSLTAPSSSTSCRLVILRASSEQGSNLMGAAGRFKSKNDAAKSSQVWPPDATLSQFTRTLSAVDTNQDQSFQERARKPAAENFDINDEEDSKWPHKLHISRANVPHLEKVYSNVRQQLKRKSEYKMEDFECLWLSANKPQCILVMIIWIVCMQQKISHKELKQLFDVTSKLVRKQTEIQGISLIDWWEESVKVP